MKEATGELSTTAIAIVAIGLILAIFTTILLPMIRSQVTLNQACNSGPGYNDGHGVCCQKADGSLPTGCTAQGASKVCTGTGATEFTCYYNE